jgi:hypothetical protein
MNYTKPDNYKIHTVLIDKKKNSLDDALNFIVDHKYKLKKIDLIDEYYRFRQLSPQYLKKLGFTEYRTITIDKKRNIKLVLAYKEKIINGGLLLKKSKYL